MSNTTCAVNAMGLWNNGDCSLLCRKTKWSDVLVFFLGNYLAHVATVTTRSGESVMRQVVYMLGALFLPETGIFLGSQAITSRAIFASSSLQQAARAGALYMVVQEEDEDDGSAKEVEPPLIQTPVSLLMSLQIRTERVKTTGQVENKSTDIIESTPRDKTSDKSGQAGGSKDVPVPPSVIEPSHHDQSST